MRIIIKSYREDIFELSEDKVEELMKEEKCEDSFNVFDNFSDFEICEYFQVNGKHIETVDSGYDTNNPFKWINVTDELEDDEGGAK